MDARTPAHRRYQDQTSGQTLAEGLAEYYAVNQGRITRPDDLPEESFALFRSHDLCHVIFGLDTTLADEAMADTRTLLSCDIGFARYVNYMRSDAQAKALFKEIGYLAAIAITIKTLPRILRALYETLRMPKRWPWTPPETYLARTLSDLRQEYRIRIV